MASRILRYMEALLGLWLIIEVSVFSSATALWIAFGTAIALVVVAAADAGLGIAQRRLLTPALAISTVLLAGFVIAATLDFGHASASWLIAIAGGVVELCALTAAGLPRLRISARAEAEPDARRKLRPEEAPPLAA